MKKIELEGKIGQNVVITLFDGEIIKGELHKTGEERFKDEPNLYIPKNYFFLTNPKSSLFRSSHIKKITFIK